MPVVTKLFPANQSTTLRTTFPMSFVKQFGLKAGSKVEWQLVARDNRMVIEVTPASHT